jgi:predicted ATPase
MALHTGPATPRADDYEGYLTLSHTKRLMSTAYGGQILLSQATEALLRDSLPPGVTLRDLGGHRLKDFERAEQIFQVVAADVPAEFPPLKSLSALPTNLPTQLTSFIGREHELSEIKQLLTTTHLLTVTGPGGTGKTRLSLQLAADVLEAFSDGVWLVELAPLADPTLVTQTIASTLGVREQPGRTILDALLNYVRTKTMLLILDNCEHLIETCAHLADSLLRAAPRLKLLASSREALGIAGETAYRVPSLPLPDVQVVSLDALSQNDCVRLFVDRALAVCGEGLGDEVLDLLTHLVDKSLVVVEEQAEAGRYRLLETIRQYARDKVFESGEAEAVRDRHLEFFLRFAEEAEPKLRGAEQLAWLERVETEHDNLRTALAWSLESGKSDRALQLAGALVYFWELRGYWSEGQKWLDDALALAEREQGGRVTVGATPSSARADAARRAKALYAAGRFRFMTLFDPAVSRRMVEESLRLWRELGDRWWMAVALEHIGFMLTMEGDYQSSRARLEEGVALAREVEDRWPLAICLVRLPDALMQTDVAASHRIREEGVAVARSVGDKSLLSQGLTGLAITYLMKGNLTAAASVNEEALAEARAIGSVTQVFFSFLTLTIITCLQGDPAKAKGYCFEVLALAREKGVALANPLVLFPFALVASFGGQPQRGVRLLAAVEVLFGQLGAYGPLLIVQKRVLERVRSQLDPAAFEAALQEGRALTPEQALALATENEDSQLSRAGLGPSTD